MSKPRLQESERDVMSNIEHVACPQCNGTGMASEIRRCVFCDGSGLMEKFDPECVSWFGGKYVPAERLEGAVDLLREARALLLETTIGSDEWERRRETWMKASATAAGGQ